MNDEKPICFLITDNSKRLEGKGESKSGQSILTLPSIVVCRCHNTIALQFTEYAKLKVLNKTSNFISLTKCIYLNSICLYCTSSLL